MPHRGKGRAENNRFHRKTPRGKRACRRLPVGILRRNVQRSRRILREREKISRRPVKTAVPIPGCAKLKPIRADDAQDVSRTDGTGREILISSSRRASSDNINLKWKRSKRKYISQHTARNCTYNRLGTINLRLAIGTAAVLFQILAIIYGRSPSTVGGLTGFIILATTYSRTAARPYYHRRLRA